MIQHLILNEKLTLSFEPHGKKVRLIVSEGGERLACRKESFKNLQKFLNSDEVNIFKGRLQLQKHNDVIEIIIKNKPVAIVLSTVFSEFLHNTLSH